MKKPVQRSCLVDVANSLDALAWRMPKPPEVQERLIDGWCLSDLRSDASPESDPLCVRLVAMATELLQLAETLPRD